MLMVRPYLDKAHMSLLLLLVVLGGSAAGGRALGFILAGLSFLAFNLVLLPPYYSFSLSNPLDWLVLVAFLVTSIVAAQLLASAREKAQLAHERAESNRLKDALLAAVSHDLRTPLTTIKALAHDLGTFGDERSEIIEQEADRLNRIVTDLLDLSQLNAGVLTVHSELNAIDDLLGALAERMEAALNGRKLDIRLAPFEPLMVGKFDLVHSLHILSNLVDNAAKFSPSHTTIEVLATRVGPELVVEVRDRGTGVPAEEIERIFEPFYRVSDTAAKARGTGLGLSIARRLAEAQGGRLSHSQRDGGGSVFALHLPAADIIDLPDR
jgi:two-component system, OmpR family, sensor histidine kinase KdpD